MTSTRLFVFQETSRGDLLPHLLERFVFLPLLSPSTLYMVVFLNVGLSYCQSSHDRVSFTLTVASLLYN
jgi:hypothetical protein